MNTRQLRYSIIIPVYNRPEELDELLYSIMVQNTSALAEVVVVDDGSNITSEVIVNKYIDKLNVKYCFKQNSGPGDSRNYGMQRASGTYFILLDSDCLLPPSYLETVDHALNQAYTDAYGGPDAAHPQFSNRQKAIDYSMTSFLTTGGLRGSEKEGRRFQLRSFNMGISREAFVLTKGFSRQRVGEDIELSFRLWEKGCSTRFINEAFVYHKRRSTWAQFFRQTRNFGAARPVLSKMYPASTRPTYWLPSFFVIGILASLAAFLWSFYWPMLVYAVYLLAVIIDASRRNRSLFVGLLSALAVLVQFIGYGTGFLRSVYRLYVLRKPVKEAFPAMFA